MPLPPTPPSSGPPSPAWTSRSTSPVVGEHNVHDSQPTQASIASQSATAILTSLHSLPHAESSNLPALQRQHVTTGYRAGVSAGRDDPEKAQAGFDEGYPVGARLGLLAGFLGTVRDVEKRCGGEEGQGRKLRLEDLAREMQGDGDGVMGGEMDLRVGWEERIGGLRDEMEGVKRVCEAWGVEMPGFGDEMSAGPEKKDEQGKGNAPEYE